MKSLALIAALLAPTMAVAQMVCFSPEESTSALLEMGAQRIFSGITDAGSPLHFWVSVIEDRWVAIIEAPDGSMCTAAMGYGVSFDPLDVVLEGEPA